VKGIIQEDHIPLNKYILSVAGIGTDFIFTTLSGIEEELNVVEMPDRTVATGGRTNTIEFSCMLPLHHQAEQAAMEAWFQEAQGDGREGKVSLAYKKSGLLRLISISGEYEAQFQLDELFPSKRALPDYDMNDDGEMSQVEWTFRASDIRKIA